MVGIPPEKLGVDEALASARETRGLIVRPRAIEATARVFQEHFPANRAILIADETTFAVAGRAVGEILASAAVDCAAPYIFCDPGLYAEFRFVEELEAVLRGNNAIPIAVGSGTINDLTKLAAHRVGRAAYMCVATAASMDGYTAFGASITFEGAKQTFNCPAPRAVVADTDVIRHAPPAMTASGYADLAAKLTAGADWILADALGVEAIDERAWCIAQGSLRHALADPAGARQGEPGAIEPLVAGLMLGGFAMQWSKTSRPASGAEHQFSHLWDMEHHRHNGAAPSHGFKVGVATLAVTRLYEQLLQRDFSALDIDCCLAKWKDAEAAAADARQKFRDSDFVETAVAETTVKQVSPAIVRGQLQQLKALWPEIRQRLRAQLLPSDELKRRLQAVGAPVEPEEIGISRQRLRTTFGRAYHIRRRFTVLDVAIRAGILDDLLTGLFGPEAPWEVSPTP